MQYLIVLLLAVSASATYNYGHSYYPSTYGHHYGGYYGGLGYSNLGYSGLGYGVGGYSYAPSSYYSSGAAVSKYIAPAVTSYAAPAAAISYAAPAVAAAPAVSYVSRPAVSYAAAPAVSYVKPAVSYAAAPAVSYVKPAVTYAAAPAVSYVKPAVATVAAAPAVSYVSRPAATYVAAAPRIQNPVFKGGHISFTMGTTSKVHRGISSSKHGIAFNSHRKEVHHSDEGKPSDFPAFPATDAASGGNAEVSNPSRVRPGMVYADDEPESNEKPSDSSFFDATRPSEKDDSTFELMKPDPKDKSSFDEDRSSEDDRSEFERFNPDRRDKSSFDDSLFDEDKSSEDERSGFESPKPDKKDKPPFDSDSSFDENESSEDDLSRFESMKLDKKDKSSFDSDEAAERREPGIGSEKSSPSADKSAGGNEKREFSGRSGVRPPFPGTPKFPGSSDKPFLAGTPKIKFVMGPEARGRYSARGPLKSGPLRKRPFRDGLASLPTLRERVFYLTGAGDVPAYGFPSVYGPSASLLYDAGGAHLLAQDLFLF